MKTRRKRLAALRRGTALAAIAGTSVLIGMPRAEAAGEIITPGYPGHGAVSRIETLSADGSIRASELPCGGRTILSRLQAIF